MNGLFREVAHTAGPIECLRPSPYDLCERFGGVLADRCKGKDAGKLRFMVE
jgi:hypothetical protein